MPDRDVSASLDARLYCRCSGRNPRGDPRRLPARRDDPAAHRPEFQRREPEPHPPHRLLGLATSVSIGRASLALAAAPTDKRLVVVILRGALDGMAAVVPYGDRCPGRRCAAKSCRPRPGQPDGLLDLGGFYGLHPALTGLHDMYQANEVLVVHAVAGSYRVRSHFEAQDYLESGADHRMTSGWLNRAVAALPPAADRPARGRGARRRRVGAAAAARTGACRELGAARVLRSRRQTCMRRSRR